MLMLSLVLVLVLVLSLSLSLSLSLLLMLMLLLLLRLLLLLLLRLLLLLVAQGMTWRELPRALWATHHRLRERGGTVELCTHMVYKDTQLLPPNAVWCGETLKALACVGGP